MRLEESYPVVSNKISTDEGHVREVLGDHVTCNQPSVCVTWYPQNNPPALCQGPLVACRGKRCTVAAMPSTTFKPGRGIMTAHVKLEWFPA